VVPNLVGRGRSLIDSRLKGKSLPREKPNPGTVVPIAGPSITAKEIAYVTDAVTNSWYGNANDYHLRFEKAFAAYVGVKHAIALSSCTGATHLALAALRIGPGDEVIVPESTWIATAAPILYVGATPVFADVDPETWCLSAESVAKQLTARTKAIIPVDLYGSVPDYDALRALCTPRGIAVIEDAAEAFGAEYRGRRAGSLGDLGVFSFHGSKTLTTGEGGMLVTNRDDLHPRLKMLQSHGQLVDDPVFFNRDLGFKYQMSAMQAALGLAQLERADELIGRKREIFSWYAHELEGVEGIRLNHELPWTRNGYWAVTLIADQRYDLPKVRLMQLLKDDGIASRPFFYPLSSLPAFRAMGGEERWRPRNPTAYALSAQAINLPSAFSLDQKTVQRVCEALKRHLALAKTGTNTKSGTGTDAKSAAGAGPKVDGKKATARSVAG
jgi:perosamine synthetase